MKGVYYNEYDLRKEYQLSTQYESTIINRQTNTCNFCKKNIFSITKTL